MTNNANDAFHSRALNKMSRVCNEGQCCITTIECDQEFCGVVENVADDPGVDLNHPNAQHHIAAAEQNNGTTKETIWVKHC